MPSKAHSTELARPSMVSSRDRDGRTVTAVAISNSPGDFAIVYADDFARITAVYGQGAWFVNKRTTRAPAVLLQSSKDGGRCQHLVARLVMGEPKGRMVEPVDGDLLNLRSSNLVSRRGGRGGQRKAASKGPTESTGGDLG